MHVAHLIISMLLLLPSLPPIGGSEAVRDDAKFFSADAIQSAQHIIEQIKSDEHRDVLIETVPDIPEDLRDQFQQKGKTKFFQDWANLRAKERRISGVYVLICKSPSHLQVAVGNVTEQKLFTVADRDELAHVLLQQFRQHHFDDGLLDGVKFIQQRMKSNSDEDAPGDFRGISANTTDGSRPALNPQRESTLVTCFGDSP